MDGLATAGVIVTTQIIKPTEALEGAVGQATFQKGKLAARGPGRQATTHFMEGRRA
jgi:hypothetical protein